MGNPSVTPPVLAPGKNNNYAAIGSFGFARLTPDMAGSSLTGIVAPAEDGTEIIVVNLGSADLTFINESLDSDEVNRFLLARGADMVLEADDIGTLIYDATSQRWRLY